MLCSWCLCRQHHLSLIFPNTQATIAFCYFLNISVLYFQHFSFNSFLVTYLVISTLNKHGGTKLLQQNSRLLYHCFPHGKSTWHFLSLFKMQFAYCPLFFYHFVAYLVFSTTVYWINFRDQFYFCDHWYFHQ